MCRRSYASELHECVHRLNTGIYSGALMSHDSRSGAEVALRLQDYHTETQCERRDRDHCTGTDREHLSLADTFLPIWLKVTNIFFL